MDSLILETKSLDSSKPREPFFKRQACQVSEDLNLESPFVCRNLVKGDFGLHFKECWNILLWSKELWWTTCHEVTFRISVLLCNTFLCYINIMYTVQYVHINCLRLNQHLMHLPYIPRYVMFYAFRRRSAPSSGVSYLTVRFSARQLTVNTWSDVFVKRGLHTDTENRTVKYETPEEGADVRRNA
jgi:hypothetical protein